MRGEITKANEVLGLEKHHINGNYQQQSDLAGKLGLVVCKGQSHLFAAIHAPEVKVGRELVERKDMIMG
jgi:hypothetical protein